MAGHVKSWRRHDIRERWSQLDFVLRGILADLCFMQIPKNQWEVTFWHTPAQPDWNWRKDEEIFAFARLLTGKARPQVVFLVFKFTSRLTELVLITSPTREQPFTTGSWGKTSMRIGENNPNIWIWCTCRQLSRSAPEEYVMQVTRFGCVYSNMVVCILNSCLWANSILLFMSVLWPECSKCALRLADLEMPLGCCLDSRLEQQFSVPLVQGQFL